MIKKVVILIFITGFLTPVNAAHRVLEGPEALRAYMAGNANNPPQMGHYYGEGYHFTTRFFDIDITQEQANNVIPQAVAAIAGQPNQQYFMQVMGTLPLDPGLFPNRPTVAPPWNVTWHAWSRVPIGQSQPIPMGVFNINGAVPNDMPNGQLAPMQVHPHDEHLSPDNARISPAAGREFLTFGLAATSTIGGNRGLATYVIFITNVNAQHILHANRINGDPRTLINIFSNDAFINLFNEADQAAIRQTVVQLRAMFHMAQEDAVPLAFQAADNFPVAILEDVPTALQRFVGRPTEEHRRALINALNHADNEWNPAYAAVFDILGVGGQAAAENLNITQLRQLLRERNRDLLNAAFIAAQLDDEIQIPFDLEQEITAFLNPTPQPVPPPPVISPTTPPSASNVPQPTPQAAAQEEDEEEECLLCMENLANFHLHTATASNRGGIHSYCRPCIQDWVNRNASNPTCPYCRTPITPEEQNHLRDGTYPILPTFAEAAEAGRQNTEQTITGECTLCAEDAPIWDACPNQQCNNPICAACVAHTIDRCTYCRLGGEPRLTYIQTQAPPAIRAVLQTLERETNLLTQERSIHDYRLVPLEEAIQSVDEGLQPMREGNIIKRAFWRAIEAIFALRRYEYMRQRGVDINEINRLKNQIESTLDAGTWDTVQRIALSEDTFNALQAYVMFLLGEQPNPGDFSQNVPPLDQFIAGVPTLSELEAQLPPVQAQTTEEANQQQAPQDLTEEEAEEICPVCREAITATDLATPEFIFNHNGHRTHTACTAAWLERDHDTCPVCRQQLRLADLPGYNSNVSEYRNALHALTVPTRQAPRYKQVGGPVPAYFINNIDIEPLPQLTPTEQARMQTEFETRNRDLLSRYYAEKLNPPRSIHNEIIAYPVRDTPEGLRPYTNIEELGVAPGGFTIDDARDRTELERALWEGHRLLAENYYFANTIERFNYQDDFTIGRQDIENPFGFLDPRTQERARQSLYNGESLDILRARARPTRDISTPIPSGGVHELYRGNNPLPEQREAEIVRYIIQGIETEPGYYTSVSHLVRNMPIRFEEYQRLSARNLDRLDSIFAIARKRIRREQSIYRIEQLIRATIHSSPEVDLEELLSIVAPDYDMQDYYDLSERSKDTLRNTYNDHIQQNIINQNELISRIEGSEIVPVQNHPDFRLLNRVNQLRVLGQAPVPTGPVPASEQAQAINTGIQTPNQRALQTTLTAWIQQHPTENVDTHPLFDQLETGRRRIILNFQETFRRRMQPQEEDEDGEWTDDWDETDTEDDEEEDDDGNGEERQDLSDRDRAIIDEYIEQIIAGNLNLGHVRAGLARDRLEHLIRHIENHEGLNIIQRMAEEFHEGLTDRSVQIEDIQHQYALELLRSMYGY